MIYIYKINTLPNPTPNSVSNGKVHGVHRDAALRPARISGLELQFARVWARGSTFLYVTVDKPVNILILNTSKQKMGSYL